MEKKTCLSNTKWQLCEGVYSAKLMHVCRRVTCKPEGPTLRRQGGRVRADVSNGRTDGDEDGDEDDEDSCGGLSKFPFLAVWDFDATRFARNVSFPIRTGCLSEIGRKSVKRMSCWSSTWSEYVLSNRISFFFFLFLFLLLFQFPPPRTLSTFAKLVYEIKRTKSKWDGALGCRNKYEITFIH